MILLGAMGGTPATAADLLRWDVTGSTGVNGSGEASVLAAGVSGSSLTGNGGTGNSSSPANTWNRNFPIHPDAASAMAGADTASKAYFEFTTSAAPGYTVRISGMTGLNLTRTTIGPTTAALFYSTDEAATFQQTGTNFTIPTNNLSNASAAASFSASMSATPIVIPGGATVHWRIVGFGSDTANRIGIGKGSTDDFTLTGTSTPDVAIHDLVWNGGASGDWNVSPTNLNWQDSGMGNAAAAFRAGDNVSINSAAAIQVAAAGLSAGTVSIGNESGSVILDGGAISGVTLTKTGNGAAEFKGLNDFPGGTSLRGGLLRLAGSGSLGAGAVLMDSNATLRLGPEVFVLDNPLSIGALGAVLHAEGDLTLSAPVATALPVADGVHPLTKQGPGLTTFAATGTTALGSQMTINTSGGGVKLDVSDGGVIFTGNGQRNLGGDSVWNAPVSLSGGSLMLHGGSIGGTGSIAVTGNSSLRSRLNFKPATITIPITVEDGVALSLDSANGDNALVIQGPVGGGGSLTKTGNGTVRIEADCAYSGPTTVEAGTLRVGNATTGLGSIGGGDVILTAGNFFLVRNADTVFPNLITGAGNAQFSAGAHSIRLTNQNSWTGSTTVTTGRLFIDADSSSATGTLTVNSNAFLGGSGKLGGSVILQANAGLAARIRDWGSTAAAALHDSLEVASLPLEAANYPLQLSVDTTGLSHFSESARSFPILKTTGGLSGLDASKIVISAPDFPGAGTWSVAQSGTNLELRYAPAVTTSPYQTWAAGAPWNLSGSDALPEADPDHDGLSNLLEFVLGGNPAANSDEARRPTAVLNGSNLVFTYRRMALSASLTVVASHSGDLVQWTTAQDGQNGVSTIVAPAPGDEGDLISVSIPLPQSPSGPGRLFVRLQATLP